MDPYKLIKRSELFGSREKSSSSAKNAAKVLELQIANFRLKKLVKDHEKIIEEKKQEFETKNGECEDLTAKNRELASENSTLKDTIRSLAAATEIQAQTISSLKEDIIKTYQETVPRTHQH